MRRNMSRSICLAALLAGLATSSAWAQEGLTVLWGEDNATPSLYDPRITQSRHEMQVIWQVFDTLIAADGDGQLHSGLATDWEVSDDFQSLRMTLREGVTFHDGTPLNSEAVQFTFDTIVDPATGSQGAIDYLGPYDRTEIISDTEFVIHWSRPYPPMLTALSEAYLAPVSPTAVQEMGNNGFATMPVGTGPFRFVQWDRGEQVILERFEDYAWAPEFYDNEGPSQVERVVIRFVENAGTRVAALESGELNIIERTPPLDMRRLSGDAEYNTVSATVSGLPFSMMLNTSQWPLDDVNVRRAVIQSVDRARLTQSLFFGFADPAYGVLSNVTPNYWEGAEDYYPYDPEAAVELLLASGWELGSDGIWEKDGEDLSIHYLSMLEPETGVALQAALRENGIHLNVENVTKARQDELVMSNDFDMGAIQWVSNDPSVLYIPFHSSNISGPGQFKFNWANIASDELDGLLEEVTSAISPDERDRIYDDIQRYIMDEAIFWSIRNQVQTLASDASLEGWQFAPGRWQVRFYDVRTAE